MKFGNRLIADLGILVFVTEINRFAASLILKTWRHGCWAFLTCLATEWDESFSRQNQGKNKVRTCIQTFLGAMRFASTGSACNHAFKELLERPHSNQFMPHNSRTTRTGLGQVLTVRYSDSSPESCHWIPIPESGHSSPSSIDPHLPSTFLRFKGRYALLYRRSELFLIVGTLKSQSFAVLTKPVLIERGLLV